MCQSLVPMKTIVNTIWTDLHLCNENWTKSEWWGSSYRVLRPSLANFQGSTRGKIVSWLIDLSSYGIISSDYLLTLSYLTCTSMRCSWFLNDRNFYFSHALFKRSFSEFYCFLSSLLSFSLKNLNQYFLQIPFFSYRNSWSQPCRPRLINVITLENPVVHSKVYWVFSWGKKCIKTSNIFPVLCKKISL